MQLMRPAALTLFALISSVFTFAQTVQKKTFFYYSNINVKPSDKTWKQFMNERDSSHYFKSFRKFDKQEISGFLEIDGHWLGYGCGMLMVPDTKKDPDGTKGIMTDTFFTRFSTGTIEYLWQYDSGGIVPAGGCGHRGNEGKWFTGFLLKSKLEWRSYFVKTKKQLYYNDELVSNSLFEFNSIAWPDIKGTWVVNQVFSNDSLLLYHRGSLEDSDFSIEFTSEKIYYLRNSYVHGAPKGYYEWWTTGDRLFMKVGSKTYEYKIISFTGPELVIQLIMVCDTINNEFL